MIQKITIQFTNSLNVNQEHDWFLDIKLYSDEYRADKTSRLMQEMNILNIPELRKEVRKFKGFFKATSRRKLISSFEGSIDSKSTLYMSILSAIASVKDRKPDYIIKSVMSSGTDLEKSKFKLDLLKIWCYRIIFGLWYIRTTGFK